MMKFNKAKELLESQSALAQRVYESTPMTETADTSQICRWMIMNGYPAEHRKVAGCLYTLVQAGLVKEKQKGYFIRENVKVPDDIGNRRTLKVVEKQENKSEALMVIEPIEEDDPLAMIEDLCKRMDELKSDMETVALKITERLQHADESVAQVRQLKKLLKGLGD